MKEISAEIKNIVIKFYEENKKINDEAASRILSEDKWSLKEIIGHLVDSASNNHQRFVRLRLEKELSFPSYHYSWIKEEDFNKMDFTDILSLWKCLNIFLAHIIETVPEESLENIWMTGIKHFDERKNEVLQL
jgi:hypothetical protein